MACGFGLVLALTVLRTTSAQSFEQTMAQMVGAVGVLDPQSLPAEGFRAPGNSSGNNYVFLQRFPLKSAVELFYHTEILVCPKESFSQEDQSYINDKISGMHDFEEIEESWWQDKTAACVELGYGGNSCSKECCSVGKQDMPLNKRQAVITNADVSKKALYVYGTGALDGETAYHAACDHKCWSNWAGTDYNILKNNCNTFTSTLLFCVYGLSQKKPSLGASDLVTVSGHCPAQAEQLMV